jgi:uncharacterized protein (DUF1778 family)
MATPTHRAAKPETLSIRIKPDERRLIDRAARLQSKTRTDFVLEAARRAAEEVLLDRMRFVVPPGTYAAFLKRLDAAPQANARLQRSMRHLASWE